MGLSATVVWEVRVAGNDTVNGGGFDPGVGVPGTDYSVQDAAQVTYTDLVIGNPTTTNLTSAAHPFTAAHVGNIINISASAGFTAGRYTILSLAGAVATVDRAVGTAGQTGGSGSLGGGLSSPGQACALAVGGNTIYIKGDFDIFSSVAGPAGGVAPPSGLSETQPTIIVGYTSNRTLNNTDQPPRLIATADSVNIVTISNYN